MVLFSCKSQVSVRFKNESSEDFKKLAANIRGKDFEFTNLGAGQTTPYLKVKSAYRYCYIKVITQKDTLTWMPFDYLGEKLHQSGKLDFRLKIIETPGQKRELEFLDNP